jgi:Tfp pilus assembly pilus retraction ATPase PilT
MLKTGEFTETVATRVSVATVERILAALQPGERPSDLVRLAIESLLAARERELAEKQRAERLADVECMIAPPARSRAPDFGLG